MSKRSRVKQKYPLPCVRCGSCCRSEICTDGVMFLDTITPPCPALEKKDGVYSCGLVVNTHKYVYPGAVLSDRLYGKIRKFLVKKFEFGVGCDSKLRCPDLAAGPSPPDGKNMGKRAVKMVRV